MGDLLVSKDVGVRRVEYFACHLLELGGSGACHFSEGFFPRRCGTEIEHGFGHGERTVFLVLRRDGELSAELLESMSEPAFGKGRVLQFVEFLLYKVPCARIVFGITCPIGTPIAGVGKWCISGLDSIDEAFRFAQREVQTAVETASAEDVVEQEHR